MSSQPIERVAESPEETEIPEDPDMVAGPVNDAESNPLQTPARHHGLTPGAILDHGRYRLLAKVGTDPGGGTELWRARDGVLGRDVAVTMLVGDHLDPETTTAARRTLERAMHTSTFSHIGVARVLDVVSRTPDDPYGVLGLVIAEWTHGSDFTELLNKGPLPGGTAARLLRPLAAAVESAHHAGLVLGTDQPQRIRITPDGNLRLAFPGPHADASSQDDVRGLGALLYVLLTGQWALPNRPAHLRPAGIGSDGKFVPPRTLHPQIPLELSTVAVRALGNSDAAGTSGGVRTGAAVLRVLEQHAEQESGTLPNINIDHEVWRTEEPKQDPKTRKKLLIGASILGTATLVLVAWIISGVLGLIMGPQETSGPSVVLGPDGQAVPPPPPPARSIPINGADVFVTEQSKDNQRRVGMAVDGNPATAWSTSAYQDQLGSGFKEGVGIVVDLAQSTVPTEVLIDSPSAGTRLEIRAVTGPQPDLRNSPVIGQAELRNGTTPIRLANHPPTQRLLVWITQLPEEDRFQANINEIRVSGSAP